MGTKEEKTERELICENDGFREWNRIDLAKKPAEKLRILAIDSPETMILQGVARLYTEETGTQIEFDVLAYDDLYQQFLKAEHSDYYDIFRMDVTWLPLLSERILVPLEELDENIEEVHKEYIPALINKYSRVHAGIMLSQSRRVHNFCFYRKVCLKIRL